MKPAMPHFRICDAKFRDLVIAMPGVKSVV